MVRIITMKMRLLFQKLIKDSTLTSIHMEEVVVNVRDTKLGPEQTTPDIPNVSETKLKNLDAEGIIRIGAEVKPGDILVGKITPKGETQLTPEERLLTIYLWRQSSRCQRYFRTSRRW
jgi:DNA-directed RNA polymerase subunit beta